MNCAVVLTSGFVGHALVGYLSCLLAHTTLMTPVTQLYHCTRESFLYLKELYVGELAPEDRHRLQAPKSSDVYDSPEPSADFLEQLRQYTPFRMEVKTVWKSF